MSGGAYDVLARIRANRQAPEPGERCEMCSEPIADQHQPEGRPGSGAGPRFVRPSAMLESESPDLPPGEYWPHQLIGLSVVTADGRDLGTVR